MTSFRNLMMRAAPAWALSLATAWGLAGCAHVPPQELMSARQIYKRASTGPAAQLAPAELHNAAEALRDAELSFKNSPEAPATRDLAYVAERKALLAEILANTQQLVRQNKGDLARTKEQLSQSELERQQSAAQLESEAAARREAERRAAAAVATLAKLASVKEEQRGLVITISGSVLFRTDEAALLPAAQRRLDQVATALIATKEKKLTIEGYTDSRGSADHNRDLSQRRAEAVLTHLVSRGYPADKIQARGLGKDSPVADNASAEGRANNRRVEIVVEPQVEARRSGPSPE